MPPNVISPPPRTQESRAIYSRCKRYRYFLSRTWVTERPRVLMFIMLNPSRATELESDNTVMLCTNRAVQDGFGSLWVLNLYAYRATDSNELLNVARAKRDELSNVSPIGLGNCNDDIIDEKVDAIIARQNEDDRIVCAWGGDGCFNGRGLAVKKTLENKLRETDIELYHLGKTDAHPRHPLHTLNKFGEERIEFQSWND